MEKVKETTVQATEEITRDKPYIFRRLAAEDVFPMVNILNKIGFKEVKDFIEGDGFKTVLSGFVANSDEKENDKAVEAVGMSIFMEVFDLLLRNLPKCENDIFQLLSNVSNLSVESVRKLDFADFAEMIMDFFKKEEFKDFIKVVSKLFK